MRELWPRNGVINCGALITGQYLTLQKSTGLVTWDITEIYVQENVPGIEAGTLLEGV